MDNIFLDIILENTDYSSFATFTVWHSLERVTTINSGWDKLAIDMKIPILCDRLYTQREKNFCLEYYIENTNEKEFCDKVSDPVMICGYVKAIRENDLNLCKKIIRWDYSIDCYKDLARNNGLGPSICEKLDTPEKHDLDRCKKAFGSH